MTLAVGGTLNTNTTKNITVLQFGANFPWSAYNYNPFLGTVTRYTQDFLYWVRAGNVVDEYGQPVSFDHAVGMTG